MSAPLFKDIASKSEAAFKGHVSARKVKIALPKTVIGCEIAYDMDKSSVNASMNVPSPCKKYFGLKAIEINTNGAIKGGVTTKVGPVAITTALDNNLKNPKQGAKVTAVMKKKCFTVDGEVNPIKKTTAVSATVFHKGFSFGGKMTNTINAGPISKNTVAINDYTIGGSYAFTGEIPCGVHALVTKKMTEVECGYWQSFDVMKNDSAIAKTHVGVGFNYNLTNKEISGKAGIKISNKVCQYVLNVDSKKNFKASASNSFLIPKTKLDVGMKGKIGELPALFGEVGLKF
eukprot:TRINITY_DN780161_c0_g1_i1.p1 TRINITY_DN780161_c0_g1~~TRINITY_DN780161_c0_g1_i1.p1  ORF type:complete len:302 (-),score=88.14 TRINITY_DN780161_c0_g1_i1:216-1079(-)